MDRIDDEALHQFTRADDCALHDIFYSDVVQVLVDDQCEGSSSNISGAMHDTIHRAGMFNLPPRRDDMNELTAMHRFVAIVRSLRTHLTFLYAECELSEMSLQTQTRGLLSQNLCKTHIPRGASLEAFAEGSGVCYWSPMHYRLHV